MPPKPDINTELPKLDAADLDLLDVALEDENKDDATIWDEIEAEETAAGAAAAPEDTTGAVASEAADEPDLNTFEDAAGKTGLTEQVVDKPGDKPDTQLADKDDPWANATPEQKAAHVADVAQISKLEQSDRSQRGRIGALQRRINESQPTKAAIDQAAEEAAGKAPTDRWKEFEGEYPEVAGPAGERISGVENTVSEVIETVAELKAAMRDVDLDEQKTLLTEAHDDWEDVIAAPEFYAWLDDQPRHMQEAAVRNGKDIVDAAEAADVIGRYKASRDAQAEEVDPTPDADAEISAENAEPGTTLSDKRQRQLAAAASTPAGGPSVATGIPEDGDEDAIWDAISKQEERERRQSA